MEELFLCCLSPPVPGVSVWVLEESVWVLEGEVVLCG